MRSIAAAKPRPTLAFGLGAPHNDGLRIQVDQRSIRKRDHAHGAGARNAECQAAIARYRTEAADHAHALAGGAPILARDMYEHAYHLFVGARTAACVDAVMDNLHWERIAARYCRERHNETKDIALFTQFGVPLDAEQVITAEELRATVERDPPVILDVCLNDDLPRRTDMLPGAAIRNSAAIDRWAKTLPHDKPILVYCFFGFQISGDAVAELRRRGYDARALTGGIGAWHAIGGRTVPLDQTSYER